MKVFCQNGDNNIKNSINVFLLFQVNSVRGSALVFMKLK